MLSAQTVIKLLFLLQAWSAGMVQAAEVAELLKKRLKVRETEHVKQADATSLPPTWFALREPDGLSGARASLPRFRSASLGDNPRLPPVMQSCRVHNAWRGAL